MAAAISAEIERPETADRAEWIGNSTGWSPARRVCFRFVFAYLVLYILPFPMGAIPKTEDVSTWYGRAWDEVVPRVGKLAFGLDIAVKPNGSGDTTYNYVQVFCFLSLAATVALVWSLLDRRRHAYPGLEGGLRAYVRFSLAATMITYGALKVVKVQFPDPSLDRLLQPFGDASPMGLLWTFMGASEGYNVFTGAGEIVGGLLLTARRTTVLGALVSAGVLAHVAALNFCYDVPVKLFSLHLLAMTAFLAAPDAGRLARVFLLGRGVEPVELPPMLGRGWLGIGVATLRTALVLGFLGLALYGARESRKTYGDLAPKSPLYGIWEVDEFEVDGEARPPLVSDLDRWRRVVFGLPNTLAIQLMSDSRRRFVLKLDPDAKSLALTRRDDPAWKAALAYAEPTPGTLTLDGTFEGKKVRARLRRVDASKLQLMSRGFHWINEFPFNR